MTQRDYAWLWLGASKSVVGGGGGVTASGGNVLLKTPPHKLDGLEHLLADDTTRLDATIDEHGLLPKLSGNPTDAFLGDGTWGPFGSTALAWFNVTTYGAVGDGTTDDTAAVNLAIAALNAATKGVLYFPAGSYKCVSALTTITASGLVVGDGMGAYDGSAYVSAVLQTSATAVLFTVTGKQLAFHDIGLFNTAAGTPSAGAGIQVSGSFIGEKVDLDSVVVSGFYVNVDRQVGSQWTNHNVWNIKAVTYGEKIQNTVNQDAGDWSISDCNYYANTYNGTAAILITGAGGGKLVNVKINGNPAYYTTGISIAIPTARDTSIITIVGCSIENVSGDAVLITTTGTGTFGLPTIAGLEVGLYSNNTGRAVKISAAAAGGSGTAGAIYGGVITGLVARTDGTARAAIELVNTDHVTLGALSRVGFNADYTSSGDTNTTVLGSGASFATPAIVLGTAAAAGAASTVIRSDSTIVAFDATAPVTQAFSDAAATGSAAVAARRDHKHGMPASPAPTAGLLLIADTHSTPIVFADVITNEAGDDFVYSD